MSNAGLGMAVRETSEEDFAKQRRVRLITRIQRGFLCFEVGRAHKPTVSVLF